MGSLIHFADSSIVVANKPKGLPMTTSHFHPFSLVDLVRQTEGLENYSAAHQLDRDTTGLVVGGISRSARGDLNGQFFRRAVAK